VTHGELNRLETEVEAARARLTADLNRLRAPETFARFKGELAAEAEHTKDEWIAKAKDTLNERTTSILDDLKARAAANPLAAVSIGAGLIWHLVRHPPIATILVGLGVYGLIRTNQNEPDVVSPVWSRAQELAASAANTVNELASKRLTAMEKSRAKQMQWTAAEDQIITDGRQANPPIVQRCNCPAEAPTRSRRAGSASGGMARAFGALVATCAG
jgi:hypothetical protein